MRFVFRQERRRQAAWQFPTAQEQAALHAPGARLWARAVGGECEICVELRCSASRRLAGTPAGVQRLSRRGRWQARAARLRQRRVRQAARDYPDVDAVVVSSPARRPHPRPRPVRVGPGLRAATPAGAGRRLARHRGAAAPAAARTARRPRPVPAPVHGDGMRDEHIESAFALEEYDPGLPLQRRRSRSRLQPVPHFLLTQAVDFAADALD